MKSIIRLFMILVTLVVVVFSWITHQLDQQKVVITVLIAATLAVFLLINLLDRRENRKMREKLESGDSPGQSQSGKRSPISFGPRERKSGLTWGGGNIKASNATRGTRRKFLGK